MVLFFFFNDTATTEIYTLSLHDALPISLLKHYSDFTQGVLDVSGLVLFLSYTVLGLFLTAQSIEAFRFQRN